MNEYRCSCGWAAKAQSPRGVLAAAERHAREGCLPAPEHIPAPPTHTHPSGTGQWAGCPACARGIPEGD